MTRKLLLLSLLLFCLAWLPATTCQAADTITTQEQNIRQLLVNSQRQEELTTILQMNSTEAQRQLLIVTERLKALEQDYEKLKTAHRQLTDSYNKMILLSQKQNDSLKKINESFEAYSKEVKAKISSLERQRNAALIGAALCLILK